MAKRAGRKLHRGVAVLLVFLLLFAAIFAILCAGVQYRIRRWKYWRPDYEKTNIEELLDKPSRTEEDYATLYAQTGLTAIGMEDTLSQPNGKQTVLDIQRYYFREITIYGEYASPVMYQERTRSMATLAHLRDGDVLVTPSTVVGWWRWGHCALVVDGENGLLLESIGVGSDSRYNSVEAFGNLPGFMVLRPKADEETRAQVVSYAKENLVGLPYVFTVGILSKKFPSKIRYTQCAHLAWYAYRRFGVDLECNGGGLVVPRDIANSDKVEIVQIFGFDPDGLWK